MSKQHFFEDSAGKRSAVPFENVHLIDALLCSNELRVTINTPFMRVVRSAKHKPVAETRLVYGGRKMKNGVARYGI